MGHRRVICLNCEDAPKWKDALGCWERLMQEPGDVWETRHVFNIDEQPSVEEVAAADVLIVGGSHYSAYEDLPWIHNLQENLRAYSATGTPIIGCCFGHQIMAIALGGTVGKNPSGRFVLGCESIQLLTHPLDAAGLLTPLQQGLAQQHSTQVQHGSSSSSTAESGAGSLCMCQVESHGDCVTALPEGATLLAHSPTAAHEMWLRDNTLCFQFHPELTPHLVLDKIYSALAVPGGRLSEAEAAAAYTQLTTLKPDAAAFGRMLLHFVDTRSKHRGRAPVSSPAPAVPSTVHTPLATLVGSVRDAVAAGLSRAALPVEQLARMNSASAEQYGGAADAAITLADSAADLHAKVTPVSHAVGSLAALEKQVDALGDVVEQLELESVMLAREVGV